MKVEQKQHLMADIEFHINKLNKSLKLVFFVLFLYWGYPCLVPSF